MRQRSRHAPRQAARPRPPAPCGKFSSLGHSEPLPEPESVGAAFQSLFRADDRRYPAYDALGSRYAIGRCLRDLTAEGGSLLDKVDLRKRRGRSDVASLSLGLNRRTRAGFSRLRKAESGGNRANRDAGNDNQWCFCDSFDHPFFEQTSVLAILAELWSGTEVFAQYRKEIVAPDNALSNQHWCEWSQ